jgi:sulfide:quinone oxidoreductase
MAPSAGKEIVIVGAGTGGVVLANELRRALGDEHRITVIERSEIHAFPPSFLWLMVGQRTRESITTPVRRLLKSGIRLLIGEAQEIAPEDRLVRVGTETIPYDFLVLASGAELESDPGSETFFTVDGAERLHEKLRDLSGGRIAVVVAATPYKCPGAPAEGAMLIADFFKSRGVKAEVNLYTPEPAPMPVAGPELGEAVRGMLSARGIGYNAGHHFLGRDNGSLRFRDRDSIQADLVVTVPRHFAPSIVRTANVANEGGWAVTDARTLATRDNSIFAIGDCAAITLPGRWAPDVPLMLPKAGVFAHAQALALAERIAALIEGRHPSREFCGDGFCMLEAGEQLAGFAYGDFYAMPAPELHLKRIGPLWHASKVMFERWWLTPPGFRKTALGAAIRVGGRLTGIPVEL